MVTMNHATSAARALLALLVSLTAEQPPAFSQTGSVSPQEEAAPREIRIAEDVDLAGTFSFRMRVRMTEAPRDLPTLAANKAWESGAVKDYASSSDFGLGRESGALAGFAISVLPDGAWTWNAGDGRGRLDHRPEARTQGIADGEWHEVGFCVDRGAGVAHLFHDGRRVALHDLRGVGSLEGEARVIELGAGAEISDVRLEARLLSPEEVRADFERGLGRPAAASPAADWDGSPLKVLAWNIWHGGRRKGADEGVGRVVDVIRESGADIVLMQETYGSGPRIADRLGFELYLRSSNLSVMSRYPIEEVHRLFSGFRFGGATIELRPGTRIQAHSLWIHYLPSVGKALEADASPEELVAADAETRGREIDAILAALLPHLDGASAIPVIVGGDFNSGSHLDWTEAAKHLANHHGRVVPWPVSRSMARAGFEDTFRVAHPDPVASRGLTWSPEFPESHQERIDYVYAREGDWDVVDSRVLDEHPDGWPSDHAAVLSTLALREPPPALRVMSYNIHYAVGMDGETDLERIADVIKRQSPDVVGLQEIGNKAMADELGRLTGMRSVFGPSKGSDSGYGDAVLSRLPFRYVGNESIPSASSSRYQAMAVDVDTSELHGDGATLRLVNTHFDWTDSIGSQEARRAAVDVVERAFCEDAPGPVILTADLNAAPGSPPLADLEARGWRLSRLGQPMLTHGAPDPTQQIDYVLVRPARAWRAIEAFVPDEPVASDHYPVVMDLRLVR